jgi:hypothetical protein
VTVAVTLSVRAVAVRSFAFGGITIGGSARLPMSFYNQGLIPAELKIDLSKYPQFTLVNSFEAEGGDGDAAPAKAPEGGSEECALIPEDVSMSTADDDPFSAESMAAAQREEKEEDEPSAMKLYTPHRFTVRIPAGQTLSVDILFQVRCAQRRALGRRCTSPLLLSVRLSARLSACLSPRLPASRSARGCSSASYGTICCVRLCSRRRLATTTSRCRSWCRVCRCRHRSSASCLLTAWSPV